jgi:hypothetical protein
MMKIETKAPDPNCPECKGSGLSPLKSMPSVSANCLCTIVRPSKPSAEEVLEVVRKAGEEGNFEMAEATELDEFELEAGQVCDAIEESLKIRIAIISDNTSIGDFRPLGGDYEAYCAEVSAKLGIPVSPGDSIVEVCRRLRKSRLS